MGSSKNAEFEADFEPVEKFFDSLCKKVITGKWWKKLSIFTFVTILYCTQKVFSLWLFDERFASLPADSKSERMVC